MIDKKIQEKIIGTLIGVAVGDSLGMPVEAWKKEQIQKYFGRIEDLTETKIILDENGLEKTFDEFGKLKYWNRDVKKGGWTDDTALTLALAKSLAEYGLDISKIAKGQVDAYLEHKQSDGSVSGGFGGTTRGAFDDMIKNQKYDVGFGKDAPGNAPAMKMSPLGIYAYLNNVNDATLSIHAKRIGNITHNDTRSVISGVLQAYSIKNILSGCKKDELIKGIYHIAMADERAANTNNIRSTDGTMLSRIEWIKDNMDASVDYALSELRNDSTVYHSYPFAVFMALKYWDEPINGMLKIVNLGGDSDTIASICGAMMGARHGNIFPKKWTDNLKDYDKIIQIADDLIHTKK